MSYPINYPTPQGANIQTFPKGGTFDWVKPQGASFVWFTLIGAGGGGGSNANANQGGGGGSGAVTNCMVPAFLIPDVLRISVGAGGAGTPQAVNANAGSGGATTVVYQAKDGTGYTLLTANGGGGALADDAGGGTAGAASVSNYFSCMGFFQSIAGQAGVIGGDSISASTTTFLSAGASGAASSAVAGGSVTANYGYVATGGAATNSSDPVKGNPYFQISPIIVGIGGAGGGARTGGIAAASGGNGGNGCGGGGGGEGAGGFTGRGGNGGDGLVVIITW